MDLEVQCTHLASLGMLARGSKHQIKAHRTWQEGKATSKERVNLSSHCSGYACKAASVLMAK